MTFTLGGILNENNSGSPDELSRGIPFLTEIRKTLSHEKFNPAAN
jgi:hypothetical protein